MMPNFLAIVFSAKMILMYNAHSYLKKKNLTVDYQGYFFYCRLYYVVQTYIYLNYTPLNRHRSVQAFLSSELPDTGDEYWIGYTHVDGQPPSWSSGADVGFTYIEAKGN